jgi:S-DNA-T family DNA segregation ATPase FtsK/SpoIIIE
MHDDGRAEVVRADMGRLVHVAVGGSSGWGKSVFLRALAYQLARSAEPVDLALVDLEGVTFAPFARCDRLLYPVANTEQAALAVFQALTREMNRRRGLYQAFPGADNLATYNTQASDPLPPIVCLVDEATALLQDGGVESAIRELVLKARKYGLWCVLGGQSWKASVLDTTIRDQMASRVQFKAMSASQSRVLLEQGGVEQLDVLGQALAILPGREAARASTCRRRHRRRKTSSRLARVVISTAAGGIWFLYCLIEDPAPPLPTWARWSIGLLIASRRPFAPWRWTANRR